MDPIDGTKNFVRGVPVWATLVALMVDGEAVVGVVSAPALGRRWWAARGGGAWRRGPAGPPRRLRVSGVRRSPTPRCRTPTLRGWAERPADAFPSSPARCWRTRAYGDFWSHMLVAEGAVDVAAEPELSLWDVAALVPVVEEAGGTITGLDGGDVLRGAAALTTNGRVHEPTWSDALSPAPAGPA